ncbi:terminase large subunit domain-containing protein [Altericroceibacterium endophyticum]|uniref:Terminase n=1 Tax=Altericroceibacterium endophyticum TaxID=1808508 RepID=A0A6I4T105_9SPHN|nr:terminase family protein [Altericroceibacterium endophyticum]MXO64834.1 terminase [Altericroceibacterium endophyticum]
MSEPPAIDPAATTPPSPVEAKRAARSLYWRGWAITQIAEELGCKYSTIASWKTRDKWDEAPAHEKIADSLEARLSTLIAKEEKSGRDFKEIDLLMREAERLARIEKYQATGKEADLNPKVKARHSPEAKAKAAATRDAKRKNCLTEEQWAALEDDFHAKNFAHQHGWWEVRGERTRKVLKSRQTGATWYFAREAFMKARESSLAGEARNQIFLSASKRQALIFRRYIVAWVRKVTGVELKGGLQDAPMIIDMGEGYEPIELHFLSTSKATAQGEHGDFYFDEFFWVPAFSELKRVASAMATHKIYKRTYFSTPSTVTHEAYPFWSGDEWNRGRRREDRREFDTSAKALATGAHMPDGSWCQVLTLQQAIAGGMGGLFDEDELRQECSEEEFRNLYGCEFIDDTESSFPFSILNPCRVDSFYAWKDYKPAEARPFGSKRVWLGYDPDKGGRDGAALVVIAPPDTPGGTFRLLQKVPLRGMDFEAQAKQIRRIASQYNVEDIGIDTSGAGQAVWELVVKWHPTARRIDYTVSSKAALVMKAQNVIRNGRFEYDAGWHDISSAFMAIRPALTKGQKHVTYVSGRNAAHGHADMAWAVMHALINEPLDAGDTTQTQARVSFSR